MKFCKDRQQRKQEEYIITHEEYMYEGISLLKNNDVTFYSHVITNLTKIITSVLLPINLYFSSSKSVILEKLAYIVENGELRHLITLTAPTQVP